MSLPDFICIGAQKAGTTWLYEMLTQNPSIWMPPIKEVHFFDRMDTNERERDNRRKHIVMIARKAAKEKAQGSRTEENIDFIKSLAGEDLQTEEWYRSVFSHPDRVGRVAGEITPAYLALPEEKIAYLKSLIPNVKILLIVREPTSRNVSQIKMAAVRSKLEDISGQDWQKFLSRLKSRGRGDYAQAIPLWQKYFPPEQLLTLPFGLIKTDPAAMMRAVETFIGAKPFDGYQSLEETVHKTREVPVPGWVTKRADRLAQRQREYLIEAFGQEFYDKTR